MRLHSIQALAGILLALLGGTGSALGQAITVRVLTDSLRTPVAGAIVRLLDGPRTVAQGLTNSAGRVMLRAPRPGGYWLKVGRIGFLTPPPWPIELAAGQDQQIDLRVSGDRVNLPPLTVEGERRCGTMADSGAVAALLWEQIRQALIATQLTQEGDRFFTTTLFTRELTRSRAIRAERWLPGRAGTGRPFVSAPPAELARNGFVIEEGDSVTYYAPDAPLLLSDPFVSTHCFRAIGAPGRLSGQIGLAFEPAGHRSVADIAGVLWVDRASTELRSLEYRYTDAELIPAGAEAGGRILFQRLPTGEWFVRDWAIRMPDIARRAGGGGAVVPSGRDSLRGYYERGGIAEPLGAAASEVVRSTLTGMIYDSLSRHGLAGVVVRVAGAADTAVTDSVGAFSLSVPVSGSRVVVLRHRLLDLPPEHNSLTTELTPGKATPILLATPSPESLIGPFCPKETGGGRLIGLTAPVAGKAPGEFSIEARWYDTNTMAVLHESFRRTNGDAHGLWAFCDLPPGTQVTVRQLDGRKVLATRTAFIRRGATLWLDLGAPEPR